MKKKYILAVTAIVVFAAITATVEVMKEKPEVKEKKEKDNDDRITPEKLQELKEKFGAK